MSQGVGFRLPAGCTSRAYNLERAGQAMDLSAHPWDLPRQQWTSPEFYRRHNLRYGMPTKASLNPEGIGFADFQGIHSTLLKGFLEQIAEKDPGWFQRVGLGSSTGLMEASEEEYHDAQAARLPGHLGGAGVAEMVRNRANELSGPTTAPEPEPPRPPRPQPEPPKPPVTPPITPPDDCPVKLAKALEEKATLLLEKAKVDEELTETTESLRTCQAEKDRLGGEVDRLNDELTRVRSLVPVVVPPFVRETLKLLLGLSGVTVIGAKTRARFERVADWIDSLAGRSA